MNEEKNLFFDGADTVKLAEKYGTPLYVMSESYILERCHEIKRDYLNKYKNTRAVFASKAFLNMEMCRIIAREGLGLDVVSGGELHTAIKAGFPMERCVFHGNNKSYSEIEMAVSNDVGRIVVDSEYELEMIEGMAKDHNKTIPILFRITPGVDVHTHKFISTGQQDSKFGIPLNQDILYTYIRKAMEMKHVELKGFHFHIGSQLLDNTCHLMALDVLLDLLKKVKEDLDFEAKEINLGGGFGIHYTGEEKRHDLSYFVDPMMENIYSKCEAYQLSIPEVTIEPGRWIVGEAGISLYTIGAIKEIPNIRTYVSVDGGMTDNLRPALYDAKYEAVIANKVNEAKEQLVTIAGKCCESSDILIWDIDVPPLETGDILAVFCTGAYNYTMANNYNRLPRPAVVMVKEGQDRLMVKRETYDDLLGRDI
ncbi:MAG: diaminopimelate decarboxylase [Clostridia bacterium]|nr:diaminopimelate decarboxylase [Clostridia bacterium]